MAFNPSSTIYLCSVPIDNTYTNQIYFTTPEAQLSYFRNRTLKTFTDYLTVKKTLPDGGVQSRVKVNANIEELYNCNYMVYQNANHGTRYFYAFITKLIYINEGTTEIVFETDVYQTWLFDVELKQSYVVREHSITDGIGENVVPEKFNFQDYTYKKLKDDDSLNEWGYLVVTTEHNADESWWSEFLEGIRTDGKKLSGIYQGLYFHYYDSARNMNNFLSEIMDKKDDCVLSISVIPKFNVSGNQIGDYKLYDETQEVTETGEGYIFNSVYPANKTIDLTFTPENYGFGAFTPKNKKLYTNPFFKVIVSNHSGEIAEYSIEDFSDYKNIKFKLYGDVSVNPSVALVPLNYKGIDENYDSGITITGFPQCSFNTDTFKLWLAKNQFTVAMGMVTGVGEIAGGVAMMMTGAGAGVGGAMIAHGATGVLGTANTVYQANREPNKGQTGSTKNNLLTSMNKNKFEYYIQTIKEDFAKTVDNFFTMYGYQTNALKVPNVSSRPYFNYVQTIDCNIVGDIPADDMRQLKAIYNTGVTLWKPHATVGNYDVDNAPRE